MANVKETQPYSCRSTSWHHQFSSFPTSLPASLVSLGNSKLYLGPALILIILLGVVQVYFHIAYTGAFSLDNRRLTYSTMAGNNMKRKEFPKVMTYMYKKFRISLSVVYEQTEELRNAIYHSNRLQNQRLDSFLHNHPKSTIFLIQIGEMTDLIQTFIAYVSNISRIDTVALMFVMENYNSEIQDLILESTRRRENQTFVYVNPYCSHLHPLWYPGDDPRDCFGIPGQRNPVECPNKDILDSRGAYRDSSLTRKKHAWVWSANSLYMRLKSHHPRFQGIVVHLDDEDVLAPDALHLLHLMRDVQEAQCPSCSISLFSPLSGELFRHLPKSASQKEANVSTYSTVHVVGTRPYFLRAVILGETLWSSLKSCASVFCHFDSNSWRDSIHRTFSDACSTFRSYLLYPEITRALKYEHVRAQNKCGNSSSSRNTTTNGNCSGDCLCSGQVLFDGHSTFPSRVQLANLREEAVMSVMMEPKLSNTVDSVGGWADPRDWQLCLALFMGLDLEEALLEPVLTLS